MKFRCLLTPPSFSQYLHTHLVLLAVCVCCKLNLLSFAHAVDRFFVCNCLSTDFYFIKNAFFLCLSISSRFNSRCTLITQQNHKLTFCLCWIIIIAFCQYCLQNVFDFCFVNLLFAKKHRHQFFLIGDYLSENARNYFFLVTFPENEIKCFFYFQPGVSHKFDQNQSSFSFFPGCSVFYYFTNLLFI